MKYCISLIMCYQMTKSLQLRLIFYTFDIKNLPQHFWHNILIKPIALNCLFIVSTRDYDMAPHYLIIPHNSSLYTHNFTRNIFFSLKYIKTSLSLLFWAFGTVICSLPHLLLFSSLFFLIPSFMIYLSYWLFREFSPNFLLYFSLFP